MTKAPSYLVLRNGIYYFQTRIPAEFMHDKVNSNKLTRRSTRTGNRREALMIARTWWVEFMTKSNPETREEAEARWERENDLYLQGAAIRNELESIHPCDEETFIQVTAGLTDIEKQAINMEPPFKPKQAESKIISRSVRNDDFRLSDRLNQFIVAKMSGLRPWEPKTTIM